MIPVLFKEDEQVFSHNGIGALYESLSCDVIEEENGSFTMELEYPVDGEWFSELKDFRIIQAKPNDIDEPHNFRIYEIEKSIDELTVFVRANTRTNDFGNNLITSYFGRNVTPQQAMNGLKNKLIEPTNFDLISDIQTRSNVDWIRINPLNAIVGAKGSLVDIFGGQIKRTNTAIYLYSRRGKDNVITIRPGKNLDGLKMTVSTAGLVTKILPIFTYRPVNVPDYHMVTLKKDGTQEKRRVQNSGDTTLRDDITIIGDVVSSQYVDNYPTNYWSSVDYSSDDELKSKVDEYIDTRLAHAKEAPEIVDMSGFEDDLEKFVKTELDKRTKQYFTDDNPGVDKPTVRMTANMFQLADSPDWEKFKDLERIGLTDTLDVWVEEYDIDVEVRVTSLTYDSIGELVRGFNAGSDRASRQSAIEKKYDDLTNATNNYITSFKNGVQNIMRNTADGLNRKFEGYSEPPAEISSEGDIWFREMGGGVTEIWIHDGVYWQPLMTEDFGKKIEADVEAVQSELEEAKLQAVADSEKALADAKAHAEAEDARIRGELESEVGGAIEIAEQAKADAVAKANQALIDAKAHAEAEDARIQQEIRLEVDGAIDIAQQAKQDAIDKANQALTDAKTYADAEIVLIGDHFDGIIEGVESDVADVKQTADTAVDQINTAVVNSGFTSLDETINSVQSISNSAQANAQTALNQSLEALGDASTALTNAQSALNQVDGAIGSASEALTKANAAQDAANILSGQVSGFETTVAGFNQTVNNYEGQVSGFRNDILGLESTVANYESEVDEFGNTVSTYATEVSTMRNTVSGFESTVATYGTEVSNLAEEVVGYQTQVSTLNNTVNGFNSVVTQVQYDLDNLEIGGRNYFVVANMEPRQPIVDTRRYYTFNVEPNQLHTLTVYGPYSGVSFRVDDNRVDYSKAEDGYQFLSNSEGIVTVDFWQNEDLQFKNGEAKIKIEKGNKSTDWTPAPEDMATATQVSTLTNTVSGFQSKVTKVEQDYAGISGTVATHTSQISNLSGELALKANTTTVNTLTGRVSTAESSITANATAITQRLTTTQVNTLVDGKGFAKETSVSTRFNDIQSTVDGTTQTIATLRTDVNGKATITQYNTLKSTVDGTVTRVGNAEGKITTIQTNVSGLQTTVASKASQSQVTQLATGLSSVVKDLGDLEIGGTNYAFDTGSILKDTKAQARVRTTVNFDALKALEGKEITYSFYAKASVSGSATVYILDIASYQTLGYHVPSISIGTVGTTWTKFEVTAKVGSNITLTSKSEFTLAHNTTASHTVEVKNLKIEKGNKATDWSPAPEDTQSQITQNANNINLRVQKNDIINQINVSTEGILINGSKTHITGTTKIDNGVIKNAHIGDLNASKINAGTINSERINATEIVAQGLTTNVIKSTHIETSTATIDKLFANDVMVNRLAAKTAFISSVQAVDISAARITSGTINAARLNASAIVTAGLTANVIKSTHIETSTATITKLFATDAAVGILTAKTAFINSVKAVDISAARITSGTIAAARLDAKAIVTAGLTANVIKSTHISGDTALFDKLFSTSSATDRLSARSAWIKTANLADASITYAKIADATIGSSKIISLDVGKISGNTGEFVRLALQSVYANMNLTGNGLSITGPSWSMWMNHFGIGLLDVNGKSMGGFRSMADNVTSEPTTVTLAVERGYTGTMSFRSTSGTWDRAIAVNGSSGNITMHRPVTFDGIAYMGRVIMPDEFAIELGPQGQIISRGADLNRSTYERHQFYTTRAGNRRGLSVQWDQLMVGRTLNMDGNNITNQSDIRLKENIEPSNLNALREIERLEFIEFEWKKDMVVNKNKPDGRHFGIKAQYAPFLQTKLESEDSYLSIDMSKQVNLNSKATQELLEYTRSLEKRIEELEGAI